MAKPQRGGQLVQTFIRRERGTAVPVSARRVTLPDGTVATVHGISLAEAEIPDRSYVGNVCGVTYERETVRIMFGQPKLGGQGWRSIVMLSMTPGAADQFLHSIERMKTPSLEELARLNKIAEEPLSDFPTIEPEQTAELVANIVAAAFSGREACFDFYHANPFSHAAVSTTNRINLEPIVRINTRTSLALSLVQGMIKLRERFPEDPTPWEQLHE